MTHDSSPSTSFEPVIGLEIHVQLATATKMFCGCPNRFGEAPNSLTCPVCLGLPGALPVLNRAAVEHAIRVGLAFGSTIRSPTKFDRKSYFYPDLPKNYQISQYDLPICEGGSLELEHEGRPLRVGIRRAHLEEDAGKLLHGPAGEDTRVDLNRAGVPLLEIVTEPEIRSSAQAFDFLGALRQTIVNLGVSDCEMQKGTLRVDTNVSLRPKGSGAFGTRVEIKNLNSFNGVRKALEQEMERQAGILSGGGKVLQETRAYDLETERTRPMRSKEEAHDYRYFPEPDLPPLEIAPEWIERLRATMPEPALGRLARFRAEYALADADARILSAEPDLAAYFERVAATLGGKAQGKEAAGWVLAEILRLRNELSCGLAGLRIPPEALAGVARLVKEGAVTRASAREVLDASARSGEDPVSRLRSGSMQRIQGGSELERVVDEVLSREAKAVADFRSGKGNALAFLVGAVMKATKGKADANAARGLLESRLKR